jgi:hypothetical protein
MLPGCLQQLHLGLRPAFCQVGPRLPMQPVTALFVQIMAAIRGHASRRVPPCRLWQRQRRLTTVCWAGPVAHFTNRTAPWPAERDKSH